MEQPPGLDTVRESYDRVADGYIALGADDLSPYPWFRAGLAAFAEGVRGLGPVLDVGCGPGTVTAHLAGLGLDASGVDLSPRMIGHARRRHPELRFSVASATALDLAPASLGDRELVRTEAYGGVPVSWTTHLWRPEQLTALLADAGLEVTAEVRVAASPPLGPQVLLAARRSD